MYFEAETKAERDGKEGEKTEVERQKRKEGERENREKAR